MGLDNMKMENSRIAWNVSYGIGKSSILSRHRIKTSNVLVVKILMFLKIPFVWDIRVKSCREIKGLP
jgi:hypothetical protein